MGYGRKNHINPKLPTCCSPANLTNSEIVQKLTRGWRSVAPPAAEIRPNFSYFWPSSAILGPVLANLRQHLTKLGQIWASLARIWPLLAKQPLSFVKIGPKLANQHRSVSVELTWPMLANIGTTRWPKGGPNRSEFAEIGPNLGCRRKFWTGLGELLDSLGVRQVCRG